jgi:hypothetical protein
VKKTRLPAEVRSSLGLSDDERVISWGLASPVDDEARYVVATDKALYEQSSGARISWEAIAKGTWEQPDFVLDFQPDDASGMRRLRIRLQDPRDLPAAVRDRVVDTVVISEYRELVHDAGAYFVARRRPGAGVDEIRWSVVFDAGLDPTNTELRAKADEVLEDLRSSLGI